MYTTNIDHTQGNIPFSWENRPGVRKDDQENPIEEGWKEAVHKNSSAVEGWKVVVHDNSSTKEENIKLLLPPPPCENANKAISHHIGLPLPPCGFQPPMRSSSRRSKDINDPFLMAYKECTKNNKKGNLTRNNSFLGSCKYSCTVRDDSIVRVADIPLSSSEGKRVQVVKHQG